MNTKQIPFRYPEELEKDFTEILEEREKLKILNVISIHDHETLLFNQRQIY